MKASSLLLLTGLLCFPASAEELTTGNLVPGMEDFTTSGGTSFGTGAGCSSGAYCTSGTTGGGGTYTSSFDVPLTQAELNQGFTLNSALTVSSHQSNSVLESCTGGVLQSGDCRDIFRLTVTLQDAGTTVETFTHQEEMDFTGLQDFTFTDVVAVNTYGTLTGIYELFGIDAGFQSGFYGPQFSNPSLTIDYQTIAIQQQVEAEIQQQIEQTVQAEIIQVTELAAPTTIAAPAPVVIDVAPPVPETTAAPVIDAPIAPPAAPVIASISPPPTETEQAQETQAEAEIEAAIEAPAPEPAPEPAEAEVETEVAEVAPEPTEAEAETEAEVETVAPARVTPKPVVKVKVKAKTKSSRRASAAQSVVDAIAPSQKYGAAAQTVTLIAMGVIAENRGLFKGPGIPDAAAFFSTASIPDGPSMVDRMTNYRIFGQANGLHNSLVESQWRK